MDLPWLRAAFSTRGNGLSHAYGPREQNLAWTPEDDPDTVAANRQRFVQAVFGEPALPLVTVRQVHSGTVYDLGDFDPAQLLTPDGRPRLEGDGLISPHPGTPVGI